MASPNATYGSFGAPLPRIGCYPVNCSAPQPIPTSSTLWLVILSNAFGSSVSACAGSDLDRPPIEQYPDGRWTNFSRGGDRGRP
jgi:hypothetical protein